MSRLILYIKPSVLFLWQINLLREATSPTFYNSPRCLPPQNSFSIHLIFFVAAHHSKGHRLLSTETFQHGSVWRELRKVYERKQIESMPQCPDILLSKQRVSVRETWSSLVFGKKNDGTNVCERKNRATYSDLVIVALVLHVLIKFFLGVILNPAHLQFLPYLQHKTKPICSVVGLNTRVKELILTWAALKTKICTE